ncbi:MAG: hypothetical protein HYZ44_06565 [Bacteroidetes bacterium]|nr:hypothetical protein [Bacteroidota bacterium]
MNRFLILLAFVAIACHSKKQEAATTDSFLKGQSLGTLSEKLHEASGLVESIQHPNNFWMLNDSGNPAEVFLVDRKAQTKMVCKLKGIANRDFESIAIGRGKDSTKTYVYAGDIGDNNAQYDVKLVYVFEEPTDVSSAEVTITNFDTLQIVLPDGKRDSEAMMTDPISYDLYLFSKREDSIRLYRVKYPFAKGKITAEKLTTLNFHNIVAADMSVDGKEVLIKNYEAIYYWKNENGEPLEKLLQRKPSVLPYDPERQGESIAWARDGSGYYTVSEKVDGELGKLLFYQRK